MDLRTLTFDQLDARTAYDVWRLRQDVFVVEQECAYPDLDGRDTEPGTRHVVGRLDGAVAGYVRVLDGESDEPRVGRVVLTRSARGRGLAEPLMLAALEVVGARASALDAQAPLAGWYAGFGYVADGPEFLEDGIPHVRMVRPAGG